MSAGIARSFKRKFPIKLPESTSSPLSVQKIDDRFIYHLVTKKRLFEKPTYDSLRQSLEAMTNHANKHKVTQISMPKAGCGLDRKEWHKVECLIKEICAQSKPNITVYDLDKDGHINTQEEQPEITNEHPKKVDERPTYLELGRAKRQDEALSKLI